MGKQMKGKPGKVAPVGNSGACPEGGAKAIFSG